MSEGLAIVVPTLGRPKLLERMMESLGFGYHVLAVVDRDDGPTQQMVSMLKIDSIEQDGTLSEKTNAGLRATTEPWVFVASDDVVFHGGWLEAALPLDAGVIGVNDLSPMSKPRHATHFFVRRSYAENPGAAWKEQGTIFHEGYEHNFVDSELCELAAVRGAWRYCPESVVEHMHPSWGKAEIDETYRIGGMNTVAFDRDEARYWRRRRQWEFSGG